MTELYSFVTFCMIHW